MKKLFIISAAAITFTAVLISSAVSSREEGTQGSKSPSISYTESRDPLYIMKTVEEEIYVFKADEEEPLYSLEEVHVKSLPQYDQSLLKTGIKIYSEKELQSLIEDYDS